MQAVHGMRPAPLLTRDFVPLLFPRVIIIIIIIIIIPV